MPIQAPAYAQELTYPFEELFLHSEGGIEAMPVDGKAIIRFWDDDGYSEWVIGDIYLQGYRKTPAAELKANPRMPRGQWVDLEIKQDKCPELYGQLHGALEFDRKRFIEDLVNAELEKQPFLTAAE